MIYLFGLGGFIAGFVLGQMILSILLKDRTRRELMTNKALHLRYGLFNWLLAGLGLWLGIQLYHLGFAMQAP